MKAFFEKYEVNLTEYDALKLMHNQIEQAKKAYKADKDSGDYLHKLKDLYCQIEDFFEVKGLGIDEY